MHRIFLAALLAAPGLCAADDGPAAGEATSPWFALGDARLPARPPIAQVSDAVLGFDGSKQLFALARSPQGLVLARPWGAPAVEVVEPSTDDLVAFAAGPFGREVVVAAVRDTQRTTVFTRSGDRWLRRELGLGCSGTSFHASFGPRQDWPAMVVDGAGAVWQACVLHAYERPPGKIVMPSIPPLRSVRRGSSRSQPPAPDPLP